LAAAFVLGVGLVIYLPLLSSSPVLDDSSVVFDNPAVAGGTGTWLTAPFYAGAFRPIWRPVTTLSYRLGWLAAESSKPAFALVNLLLLSAGALLVFLLLQRLGQGYWGGLVVAALLLAHPASSESVLRLAGRSELMSNGFLLGALLLYVARINRVSGALGSPTERRGWWWTWLAWGVLFLLGLLSRETALMLPVLVVGYEATVGTAGTPPTTGIPTTTGTHATGRLRRSAIALTICVVLALFWVAVRGGVLRGWPPEVTGNPAPDYVAALSTGERVQHALRLPALYSRIMLGTADILPDYTHLIARSPGTPPVVLGDPRTFGVGIPGADEVVQGVVLLALGFLLFGFLRRKLPVTAFGGWVLGVGLLAALPLLGTNGHVASSRHIFLPLFGLLVVVVSLVRAAAGRIPSAWQPKSVWVFGALSLFLLIGCMAKTRSLGRTWSTQNGLIGRLAEKAPLSPEVPLYRAAISLQMARASRAAGDPASGAPHLERAAGFYEEAIGLFPRIPRVLLNLGLIRAEQGQTSLAGRSLSDAALVTSRIFPGSGLEARVYVAHGTLLGHQGLDDAALAAFQRAVRVDSLNVQALARAGLLEALQAGTARDGLRHMRRALELDRNRGKLGPLAVGILEVARRSESCLGLLEEDSEAYNEAMRDYGDQTEEDRRGADRE
jgi:hypothetical protein